MNSYTIYRIAETLRVLLFMTAAILIFNFYPLTAIMIVMLALLNDGTILSIAYDNVKYENEPEAWNMRRVLGVASVLGIIGPIAAFGLFFLGDRVFHLDHKHLQPMMYLMLSVAGHMTIFSTRTRGPVLVHKTREDFMDGNRRHTNPGNIYRRVWIPYAIPGLEMGWVRMGIRSCLAPLSDRVKLLAYRIFDPVTVGAKPEANAQAKSATKIEDKSKTTSETKGKANAMTDTKAQPKSKPKLSRNPKINLRPRPKLNLNPRSKLSLQPEPKSTQNLTPKPSLNLKPILNRNRRIRTSLNRKSKRRHHPI